MSDSTNSYLMPDILDLMAVEGLHESLSSLILAGDNITIDCGEVARITTPAVQVLLSFAIDLEQAGHQLKIINVNNVMKEAFKLLGLETFLAKWSD